PARAARSRDLLGVQPKLTQVPPVRFRSAKATVCPALAAVIAAVRPHGPPPTTTNSYTSLGRGDCQSVGWPWAIVRRFGASKGAMLAADISHLVRIVAPNRIARPNHRPGLHSPNTTLSSGARAERQAPHITNIAAVRCCGDWFDERLVEQPVHSVQNK